MTELIGWYILFISTGVAVILGVIRGLKGPTAPDRTVAVDTLTTITTTLMATLALFYDRIIYLDVALVYAVLAFIGVLAIARYLEGGF